MGFLRRNWKNILLSLVSLLIALVAAEFILRALNHETVVSDPILENAMQPGGDYDANGFRNPAVLTQADIVAIGDSQTEGNNATREEAWPLALGSLASTSVYSMAVGGFGPVQYAYLAEKAVALHPKLAIVGFYFGNDLADAERTTYTLDAWKTLRDPSFVPPAAMADPTKDFRTLLGSGVTPGSLQYKILKVRLWVRAHSKLYALLGDATRSFREQIGVANTKAEKDSAIMDLSNAYPDIAYVYDHKPSLKTVLSPTYRLGTVDLDDPVTREGWRIAQDRLLAIKKTFDAAHIPFVILIIPTKEKVYLDYMRSQHESIEDNFTALDVKETALRGVLEEFCSANSMTCTSALPSMVQAMASGTPLYGVTMDGHPLAAGYRVIAKYLYQFLIEHKLLSS